MQQGVSVKIKTLGLEQNEDGQQDGSHSECLLIPKHSSE